MKRKISAYVMLFALSITSLSFYRFITIRCLGPIISTPRYQLNFEGTNSEDIILIVKGGTQPVEVYKDRLNEVVSSDGNRLHAIGERKTYIDGVEIGSHKFQYSGSLKLSDAMFLQPRFSFIPQEEGNLLIQAFHPELGRYELQASVIQLRGDKRSCYESYLKIQGYDLQINVVESDWVETIRP